MNFICKRGYFFIILISIFFLSVGSSFGEQLNASRRKPPSAQEMVEKMKQELALSDEQVKQVTPIIQYDMEQRRLIMSQSSGGQAIDKQSVMTQLQALRKSTESKLGQYLTPEQLMKLKNTKHERPPQDSNDRMGPPSEMRLPL